MTDSFGISEADWTHWDLVLGLGPDLLPVVCRPGQPVDSSSKLKSYGKVPSLYTSSRTVVGIPKWTRYQATDRDLELWSAEPDYGICLQTRDVKALDCDITEAGLASDIWATIQLNFPGVPFPCRRRSDSSKFLFLFGLPGEYGKRTLKTKAGMIEFLATGQQCLVAGTHKDGSRYEWVNGLPVSIPQLAPIAFEQLWLLLVNAFAIETPTESRVKRIRGDQEVSDVLDPVVQYLMDQKLVTGRSADGRVYFLCPWRTDHTTTSDVTETVYFPAGTGGYELGHMSCLHAHCSGRTDQEFLDAIGYTLDGFSVLDANEPGFPSSLEYEPEIEDLIGRDPSLPVPLDLPRFVRNTKTGVIKPLLQNVVMALRRPDLTGCTIAFDVFRDELVLRTAQGLRPFTDTDYTRLRLVMPTLPPSGCDPIPHEMMRHAVHLVAQESCFDSAQDWLTALPEWDRIPRVETFCSVYLGAEASPYAAAVSRYLWTAMPGRILQPGIQADMTIILVSPQGTGKSSAVRALAPSPDLYVELSLSDRDADLARLTRGVTLVELAELRGLHSREMEMIKAFVTKRDESWVPKYFEHKTKYARRFIMIGTTNEDSFLGDVTGSRRWLPLKVGQQDVQAIQRDRLQLWAEGQALYLQHGILWEEAQTIGKGEHRAFETYDSWQEDLAAWLERPELDGQKPSARDFLLIGDVMRECFHFETQSIKRADQLRVGDALKRLGYQTAVKWLYGHSTRVWVKIVRDSKTVVSL